MDQEYRNQLIEQRRIKRRILHELEMKKAIGGLYIDPSVLIQAEDVLREIRSIDLELGEAPTPTVQERRATPLPRYQPPMEPEPVFQQRMVGQKDKQADIEHQMTLLKIHRRNLAILREQARHFGSIAAAPLSTQNSILDTKEDVRRVKAALRQFGQDVQDLPGDE